MPPLRISNPPLATVSETTVPPKTTISPPEEMAPLVSVPPDRYSVPPLPTTVPEALPPELTKSVPPACTTAERVVPPNSTICCDCEEYPEICVLDAVTPEMTSA